MLGASPLHDADPPTHGSALRGCAHLLTVQTATSRPSSGISIEARSTAYCLPVLRTAVEEREHRNHPAWMMSSVGGLAILVG